MDNRKIEDRIKRLTPIEHVLMRPGMYVGSLENEVREAYVVTSDITSPDIRIGRLSVTYNPAFYKLFDEIIINASDHHVRTGTVTKISVTVTPDSIRVENDGDGVPVVIHKEHNLYVPEILFGHLLSGENFDDESDVERFTGGLHGLGAKCVNIYSTEFTVETADGKNRYTQVFTSNLSNIGTPIIKKCRDNYTIVTYKPDFKRFGIDCITVDMQRILFKRVVDIAAYCPMVDVYYNGMRVSVKSYGDYIAMHLPEGQEFFHEAVNENWIIGVTKSSEDSFQHESMVNGIHTSIGGTHVNMVTKALSDGIKTCVEKKNKKISIKPTDISNKLHVFVNCRVSKPTFDSQTKENLKTRLTSTHVKDFNISDKFYNQVSKSSLIEDIMSYVELREKSELNKKSSGKSGSVKVKKLDDANKAGTSESSKCTLMLSEGDSAKSFCISGFAVTGREYFGVFPLKGKPLNVRGVSMSKIKENEEIMNLCEALGLEFGKVYTDVSGLRYGKLCIISDADCDGYHIKGLIINFFERFFPSILELKPEFIHEFVTPIVKVTQRTGKKVPKYFYKLNDYNRWKETARKSEHDIKYFKGLGTLEPSEAKMLFRDIDRHMIKFVYGDGGSEKDVIDMLFNKNRADERKEWLRNYTTGTFVDKFSEDTTYMNFFQKEFIEYSMYDNIRSIPSVVDGFKPSQRKILYGLLKKNQRVQMKVSQLTGGIIEVSAYHHGPASLEGALIAMAQDFVGSNNFRLLQPIGQFGTRLKGGADAASSRYIFTMLNEDCRKVFTRDDDDILDYNEDDGYQIEPVYYAPVVPMVLVNGADGIGTGWSTEVPKYSLTDIVGYLTCKLRGKKVTELLPFYDKFTGEIIAGKNKYTTRGIISMVNATTLRITELPINMWNDKYYEILDGMVEDKVIKNYVKHDTDEAVNIVVTVSRETMKEWRDKGVDLVKLFSLETTLSTGNMHLFDASGKIKKYDDVHGIIADYYDVRLSYYGRRKDRLVKDIRNNIVVTENKIRFVGMIISGELVINNTVRSIVEQKLTECGVSMVEDSYSYLLNMPVVSLTSEKLVELGNSLVNLNKELGKILSMKIETMWLEDLKKL